MNRWQVFAVLALTATNLSACAARPAPAEPPPDQSVPLAVAHVGSIEQTALLQGHVGLPSGSSAKLAFPVAGVVATVAVHVGQRVDAGSVLAELDRTPLAAPLEEARASERAADAAYGAGAVPGAAERGANGRLAVALARLRTVSDGGPAAGSARVEALAAARQAALTLQAARLEVARRQRLFAAGVIAQKDLDAARFDAATAAAGVTSANARVAAAANDAAAALLQAQSDVAAARSDVAAAAPQRTVLAAQAAAARARVDAARVAYDGGSLVAPRAGTVLGVFKHVGESVDAATPVVEVGDAVSGTVTLTATADDARRIASGAAVTIALANGSDARADGRILAVVPAADGSSQAVLLEASGVPAGALPGEAVNGTVLIARRRGIVVPTTAIVEEPESGATVVFLHTAKPDTPFVMQAVTIGPSDATKTLVTNGLRPGQSVAASGAYTLLAPAGGG